MFRGISKKYTWCRSRGKFVRYVGREIRIAKALKDTEMIIFG